MPRKEDILAAIRAAKEAQLHLPVHDEHGTHLSSMRVMGSSPEEVKHIADWREAARDSAPTMFPYNLENTRRWVEKQVDTHPERILFFLETPDGERWGHLGLATFGFEPHVSAELDAIMRGREDIAKGVMTPAIRTLMEWGKENLGIQQFGLRVFSDNERAIRLYERLGFERDRLIPMIFEKGEPISKWRECLEGEEPGRYFLVMRRPA
ncbi:GNAT family N-acetyltransferase [Candidatus Peregrinibacteria bacterium]|nr:GNAT family N-acetyltransferase [Candidatus Peregrinibacteria bacterium]